MLASTLLVDIGQLGDIFFPFTEVYILEQSPLAVSAPLKTLESFTTLLFSQFEYRGD